MTSQLIFNWKLLSIDYKKTIFEKKKCVEKIEVARLYGFIKADMGISYLGHHKYDYLSVAYPTELEQMKEYKKTYDKQTKQFQVSFHLPKHKWGRIIPSNNLSLSVFRRSSRHTFCDGSYIDLDMQNAQPTIINEICRQNSYTNKYLDDYVKDPKKFREIIMKHHNCDKDTAKELPIILMFGGCYSTWLKENDISVHANNRIEQFVEIESFMRSIIEIVYNNNQHIKKDVLKQNNKKWETEEDAKRGVMALWCQSIEKIIQEDCIAYLVDDKKAKLEEIIPCQDGFMIRPDIYYDGICSDLRDVIKNKYNIDVKWIQKPFDEKIKIKPYSETLTFEEWVDRLSVKCMADKFSKDFGDYVIRTCGGELNVFWGDKKNVDGKIVNGRWYNETDKDKRFKLYLYISESLFESLRSEIKSAVELEEKDINYLLRTLRSNCSNSNKINDIIKHVLTKTNQITQEFNGNPFLLGFDNGVYDLKEDCFRDYEFDDYITFTTKYDYKVLDYISSKDEFVYTDEQTQKIHTELVKIIEDIHPDEELRNFYLLVLASGLDGRAYQKLFLFNGEGGNGKGLTGALMDTILGDYYYQPSNGILKDVEKSNTPSPDMYNLKGKRYINFKEVEGSVRLAVFKNLTGGGKFVGRLLHCNPENFTMNATFVMEFNIPPELDGKPTQADYRRLVDLFFSTNFTDDKLKVGKTIGEIRYKHGNTYYETQEFLQKFRNVFLNMLLDVYRKNKDIDAEGKTTEKGIIFTIPDSIKERTNKFIENQNLFIKLFNNNYIKSDTSEKIHKLKDLWETITYDHEHKSLPHSLRKQYGRDAFYKWCHENLQVSGGQSTKGLTVTRIKKIDEDDD